MKTIAMLLFTLIMGKGCSGNSADLALAKITYTAQSRGVNKVIIIQNKNITVESGRGKEATIATATISEGDWSELARKFEKMDLEKIETYADPSQERFYDGAAIANLTVEYNGKTYRSKDFDHGNPPNELKAIVDQIFSLISEQ
jgi:hypothetical protein